MANNAWYARNEEFQALKARGLTLEQLQTRLSAEDLDVYVKWLMLPLDFDDYVMDNGISASDFALEYVCT